MCIIGKEEEEESSLTNWVKGYQPVLKF